MLRKSIVLLGIPFMVTYAVAAELVAVGTKATLSAEYLYESAGKKATKNDSHEWKVYRFVSMSTDLISKKPTSLSMVQEMESGQKEKLDQQAAHIQKLSDQMAPVTMSIEKIMAKCGDDDACIERESMQLGLAMSNDKQTAAILKSGSDTAKIMQQDAPRYQMWGAKAIQGSYKIDESAAFVDSDPLCMEMPGARCHRSETRKGSGSVPESPEKGSTAALLQPSVEIDVQKNSMILTLPLPTNLLPIEETIVTDKPHASEPKGPQKRLYDFRILRDSKAMQIPIKGNWRSQSGENSVKVSGDGGEGGTLRIRWRLEVK